MYGQYPFGPYGPQQAPQVVYVPIQPQPNNYPPMPPTTNVKPPKAKTLSAKRIAKIAKSWNDLLEEAKKTGGGDKDSKKDKKLKDHTFNWWDMTMLLCVFSLPMGTAMLAMVKVCTLMLKATLALP